MATKFAKKQCGDLRIKIQNIDQLEATKTPNFRIQYVLWSISIAKIKEPETNRESIWLYLSCKEHMESSHSEWAFAATASFKLMSHTDKRHTVERIISPSIFNSKNPTFGIELVQWFLLFNTNNDYIENNSITLDTKIITKNLSDMNIEWRTMFDWTLEKPQTKFQIKIKDVSNLVIVRSSKFLIDGILFVIDVSKVRRYVNELAGHESYLAVYLRCIRDDNRSDWSCKTRASFKLISSEQNVEQKIRFDDEYDEFDCDNMCWGYGDFLLWRDLMNSSYGYVNNDSILLEVEIFTEQLEEIKPNAA